MTIGGHGTDGVERRGLMFVLSSPSGAGKTTLSRMLIDRMPGLRMSVSATTRAMRPGEVDGRDYSFVDKATFGAMVKADQLLEWATVFDNSYGTPRAPVEAALSAGQDVLFDIDWQGTQQLREKARADVRQRVHPAALGCRSREAAAFARAGFRRGDPQAHEPRQPRDEPLGRVRLHRHQPRR
ncbi:guanylate kinase [Bradyrhizobium sp. GM0.4]